MPDRAHFNGGYPEGEASSERTLESLLASIRSALDSDVDRNVFAVGGEIDADASTVVIRWDASERDRGCKVSLPVDTSVASQRAFAQLREDCEPATFGLASQEVLDETYRKAGKMDNTMFSTTFCPYEHGVMDTTIQALVHTHPGNTCRGLRAELYKLNIYSEPSGRFRAHVDTPRSEAQMGSLVVSLPHPFQGGQLVIRHAGRRVNFDWASETASQIQWAVFFSDCEHEVLEVTRGHRVTLTYNLYWTDYGPASTADHLGTLDLESLHFFPVLRKLLDCPEFFPKGGKLGFTCTHAYPHTSRSSIGNLHHTLKGLDMIVYQALKRLTGSVRVTAWLNDEEYKEERREQGYKSYSDENSQSDDGAERAERVYTSDALLAKRPGTPILWEEYEEETLLNPQSIGPTVQLSNGRGWRHQPIYRRQNVTWLNHSPDSGAFEELAVAFIAYGNQPGIGAYYSSAVIVAELGAFR